MKDSTIIQNFQQLNNKYERLLSLTQQNLKQIYMIQTASSMTIDALSNLLIDKGLMTMDDVKLYIEKTQEKRSQKAVETKDKELEAQPVFNTHAGILQDEEV